MNKDMHGPPPPGFAPPQGFVPPPPYTDGYVPPTPQQSIVIVQSPNFGSDPVNMTCPHCRNTITTRVDSDANTKTHLFALLLCLIGCWPCAPCPYCIDSCLVQKHYCPSCGTFLGQSSN